MFDVVNERDEVTGQRSREDVHRLGLRHRAVHLLVFASDGRVFLQKRAWSKDENPGQWDTSVAGHVDAGEHYDQCVVREAREEIGITLADVPEHILSFDASAATAMEFTRVYRVIDDGPFTLDPDEIMEGHWFTPEFIDQAIENSTMDLTETFRTIWARYTREIR